MTKKHQLLKLFGTIEKVQDQEDGSIVVAGYASSESVDSDGEIVTAEAMKAALPGYMKFANIREMHQPSAVGVALDARVEEDGKTWMEARIVDESAIKKVRSGVYKGFSIGARVKARDEKNSKVIKSIDLYETSLVDRPANPDAVLTMFKVDLPDDEASTDAPADDTKKLDASGEGDKAEKSGYTLQRMIDALSSLKGCCEDMKYEAQSGALKGIDPDELNSAMKSIGEYMLQYSSAWLDALVAKAETGKSIEKRYGPRYNEWFQGLLKSEIDAGRVTLPEKVVEVEVKVPDPEVVEQLTKLRGAHDEFRLRVAKAFSLAEGDDIAQEAEKRAQLLADSLALVKKWKDLPAPAKGVIFGIDKAEDVTLNKGLEIKPITKNDGSVDEAATLMKQVLAGGGSRVGI